jgi:hypothetical protein
MLLAKLESDTDIKAISTWAFQMYFDNSRQLEPGLKNVLMDLGRMEDAPEFEFTVAELSQLAKSLAGDKTLG